MHVQLRSSKFFKTFLMLCALLAGFLPAHRGNAQLTGATLSGQVTDVQRAVIPGASLVIRNLGTDIGRTVTSNGSGIYTVSDLQPGLYSVTATANGFSTFIERNVQLNVGTTRNLDVILIIGAASENITVIAGAADVETDTSVVSATVGQKRIVELPLNGRDWTQLATLQPGVINVRTQASVTNISSNRASRGYGNALSANGHSPYENTYRIDGINENDYSNGAPGSPAGVNLGVDAIQEFSVVTTAYTAEYGRTSGAVINAVTRSGTNNLHGTAYFFDRDKIFDAKNAFDNPALPIPSFRRVQYGAALGGPIRKDHVFAFGNYEALRQAQSLNLNSIVPSATLRNGQVFTSATAFNNVAVNPTSALLLALYPLPNSGLNAGAFNNTGNYATTGVFRVTEDFAQARVDDTFSANDTLSLTFLYDNAPSTLPDIFDNITNESFDQRDLGAITERHIFGSNLINVLRIGFNRNSENALIPYRANNPATASSAISYFSNLNAPMLTVSGLTTVGGLGSSRQSNLHYNSYQVNDDVAFVIGRHSLKAGFAGEQIQDQENGPVRNGTLGFVATGTTPALQNLLVDAPFSAQVPATNLADAHVRATLLGGYLQDDFRFKKNLSLNLGVRYEILTIPIDPNGKLGLIRNLNAPLGSTGPCPAVVSATSIPGCTVPVSGYFDSNPTLHNFEPRIGFSYDPFSNEKTAFRGGFGIYDLLPLPAIGLFDYTAIASPYEQDRSSSGNLPAGQPLSAIATFINSSTTASRLGHYIDPNPKRDYSLNYNVNIEQQFSKTVSGTIGYVGSHSVHNPFQSNETNFVSPSQVQVIEGRYVFPALTPTVPVLPTGVGAAQDQNNIGEIFALFYDNSSHYNGLLTQLKVSNFHGLVTQASYSWQKCIDYGPTKSPGTYTNTTANLNYYDKAQRQGACDYVLAQNFSENTLYELPGPTRGVMKAIIGGFQIGAIVTASTGSPFTVVESGDVVGQKGATSSTFPDFQAGCNPYSSNFKTNGRVYLNGNCFSYPTVGANDPIAPLCRTNATPLASGQILCSNVMGNERRGLLIGPHLVDIDASLIKNTRLPRLSESANLQLRVEAFNVLNHANYQAPTDNLTLGARSATSTSASVPLGAAGTLSSTATSSRQIQLGAKIIF